MQIQENISLRSYNTFRINAKARYFSKFSNIEELSELINSQLHTPNSQLILGGGSNILLTKDINGLVLKNEIKGIQELHEDKEYVYVKVGAGENWHSFVLYCIERNWGGVENLSLIPGNVGASPMQNIGAYGVELEEVFWNLEAFHIAEKKVVNFTKQDCEFGYRESVFKKKFKDQFIILNVTFQLRKHPVFNTSYAALKKELEQAGVKELSIKAISDAVIRIRRSKLPDPAEIGNAGSFFKNPEISNDQYSMLNKQYSNMPGYPITPFRGQGVTKVPAAWLIEQAGWKGFREGDAGVHTKQALVLVNYGNAKGDQIYDLSEKILDSVRKKFGVTLEREVNII